VANRSAEVCSGWEGRGHSVLAPQPTTRQQEKQEKTHKRQSRARNEAAHEAEEEEPRECNTPATSPEEETRRSARM
jgi:hypothetical protein